MILWEFPVEILHIIFEWTEIKDILHFHRAILTWKGPPEFKEDWSKKVLRCFVGLPYQLERGLHICPKKEEGFTTSLFEIPTRRIEGKILLMGVNSFSKKLFKESKTCLLFWELSPASNSLLNPISISISISSPSCFSFPSILNSSFRPLLILRLDTEAEETAKEPQKVGKLEHGEGIVLLAWIYCDLSNYNGIEVWEIDPNPKRAFERQSNRCRLFERFFRVHDHQVIHFIQYHTKGQRKHLKVITVGTDKILKIWNLRTRECEINIQLSPSFQYDQIIQLSWSIDGRILIATSSYIEIKVKLQLWNMNHETQSGNMIEEVSVIPMKGDRQGLRVISLLELHNQDPLPHLSSPHHSDSSYSLQAMILLNNFELQRFMIAPLSCSTSNSIICLQRFDSLPSIGNHLFEQPRFNALELQDGRIALLFGEYFNIYSLKSSEKVYCCNRFVHSNSFLELSDGRIATATSTGIIEFWKRIVKY